VELQSNGVTASMIPVKPATRNWSRKAQQNIIGVAKRILPPYMVAVQLKILIPVGTPTSMLEAAKKVFAQEVMPTANI